MVFQAKIIIIGVGVAFWLNYFQGLNELPPLKIRK